MADFIGHILASLADDLLYVRFEGRTTGPRATGGSLRVATTDFLHLAIYRFQLGKKALEVKGKSWATGEKLPYPVDSNAMGDIFGDAGSNVSELLTI